MRLQTLFRTVAGMMLYNPALQCHYESFRWYILRDGNGGWNWWVASDQSLTQFGYGCKSKQDSQEVTWKTQHVWTMTMYSCPNVLDSLSLFSNDTPWTWPCPLIEVCSWKLIFICFLLWDGPCSGLYFVFGGCAGLNKQPFVFQNEGPAFWDDET